MSVVIDPKLVDLARGGDREALGTLLDTMRTPLYRLAVSMLWNRDDAEDATQEALIAVMTNLATFRGDSSVSTWAHRIAVRLYLRRRQSPIESLGLTFDTFAADLLDGLAADESTNPDAELLAEETRIGCTLAVLQCLDREERLVFVLGDVLALPGQDAADVLGVSHDVYRKRLSRVRSQIRHAVSQHCGLINADAPCRCSKRVDTAVRSGRVQPDQLRFVDREALEQTTRQIQHLYDVTALFRSAGQFNAPDEITAKVLTVLTQTGGALLGD
jgi:RNA polymerase sigma factor (sigma-70 family)